MNLFVEMFMVRTSSGGQRKPRPGNTSDTGMTETSVLVTQHMAHMIGLQGHGWKSEEYTSEGAFVVPA